MTWSTRDSRPADVAASFELRGRTRACVQLVDVYGKDVLNIGSSIGWFEREVGARGARSVVGIDVTDAAMAVAREFAPAATFVRASALDLPFAPAQFDLVTMFDVLEHLPRGSEPQALLQIRNVLRPAGELALTTPNRHWFSTPTDPAYYLGHRHYRLSRLTALLMETGFVVERTAVARRLFDQLDVLLYYAWRHLFRRERHPFGFVRRLADHEWQRGGGWNTLLIVARVG